MLVPLSWLADYVSLPADPAALIDRLTLAGLEAAGARAFGRPAPAGVKADGSPLLWENDKVVVAKVLRIEKHPDADKLKLVTVDYGAAEPKTVVTGAPNIAPGQSGMKVVLGLRGTKYFYTDKDGKKAVFTLEPKALRGVMNDAMCMSDFELGVSEEHEGIILLDESDPAPGTPAADFLADVVVEIDVLPNMARCLALLGIAREVAALTGAAVCEPDLAFPTAAEPAAGKVTVAIADPKLCPRYSATIIRNVTVGPAPRQMRARLLAAGMRPISNVVDATNYVMLEYGQPLHAFDYDKLLARAGGKPPAIVVRPAKAGETLKTLDGQLRELSPENLVIADAAGPVALAGVMGGFDTEVSADTRTILLESAAFDPVSVRRTARQFTLFSEASTRYSRGVHPEVVGPAAKRAAQLLHRHAGGEVLAGTVDAYPAPVPPRTIRLKRTEIVRLLGTTVPDADVERVLAALQFAVAPAADGWSVTEPATRLDIQSGPADLIEEVARVTGYDRLPERRLPLELPEPAGNPDLAAEDRVKDLLADAGLQEVVTYSLTSPEREAKLASGDRKVAVEPADAPTAGLRPPLAGGYVRLLNPVSPERAVLRKSLLPNVLEVAARNLAVADGVALFEAGFVYLPAGGGELPAEPRRLCVVLCGRRSAAAWDDPPNAAPPGYDFFDLKGVLEGLAGDLHLPDPEARPTRAVPHLHPGRGAEVLVGGKPVGHFGELHPSVAAAFGLAERSVQAAELDLDAILAAVPGRWAFRPSSDAPAAKRDVAVIVPADTPAAAVLAEVTAAGGDLLAAATLFDVYTGDRVPAGTKSLAFALTYQADRTLTDKEIDKAHQKIEGRLRHVLKAQIRGKDAG